jgi:predicted lipoprotein with Yx(FWY)xxD motif
MRILAVSALSVIVLGACGSSSKTSSTSNGTSPPATDSSGYGSGTLTPATTASGEATVSLAAVSNPKVGSTKVLVDDKGMTLYVWDNDKTAGEASCKGACAQAWPPLVVEGTPTYGTGLDAAKFSVVKGPNGEKQLAVNGKPLYLWAADKKAGDATGDGVNGFYVVAANGDKIDND